MRSEAEVRALLAIAQHDLPEIARSASLDQWSAGDAAALAEVEARIQILTWMLESAESSQIVRIRVSHTDGRSFYLGPLLRPSAESEIRDRQALQTKDPAWDTGWSFVIEEFVLPEVLS